ncbi:MAG: pyridoxamine 5'-phosphate oxidase family protein [Acidobacteria bacterium]|nr:pyridoxamine 5'-phosphate oxidase family protein [Acidobacteriota bacterium]
MLLFVLFALQVAAGEKELEAARAVISSARYCFLITLDGGQPQARLMEPLATEADMRIWFGTNPKTRKVGQIRRNPRSTVACYDPAGPNYVTLLGHARIVEDVAERRRRWRDGWEKFFPGGPAGPNYLLVEFTPDRIEIVSNTHGVANQPASLAPLILQREGKGWKLLSQ